MASNRIPNLQECTGCHEDLNLQDSKTLPCLHSFCRLCLDKDENEKCPECRECFTLDQLSLSPILCKTLRRQQLEMSDWKCDLCKEEGIESVGIHSCNDCQKIFCSSCSKFHERLHPDHNSQNLEGTEKSEVIQAMIKDMCSLHHKEKYSYCQQCNICACDTCYKVHLVDSPGCPSQPLSVEDEASKLILQGPTLTQQMTDLEIELTNLNQTITDFTVKLNSDCSSRCQQLWENYEEIMEMAKQRTNELCKEIKELTEEQVERWRQLLEENENILKKIEVWRLNLRKLLDDCEQKGDIVCGLQSLKEKFSSWHHRSVEPDDRCQLEVSFPDWWLKTMEELRSQNIGSVSLTSDKSNVDKLILDKQWKLQGSDLNIQFIYVTQENNHVFIGDYDGLSIIEYTEWGEFVSECKLTFTPYDMCLISPNVFVIANGDENQLVFLERKKAPPSLQIIKSIPTDKKYYSLFERNGTIFACNNNDGFEIDSFTNEGKKLGTIKTQELGSNEWAPLIRANLSTERIWGMNLNSSESFCYNFDGKKLCSMNTEEYISSFCCDERGNLYYCTAKGIFSSSPENALYKFDITDDDYPRICTSKNRLFLYCQIDGEDMIKIFKIFH